MEGIGTILELSIENVCNPFGKVAGRCQYILLNNMGTVVFGSCYFEVAITFDLESWKSRVSASRIALLVGIQSQLESVFASPRSKKSLVHVPS